MTIGSHIIPRFYLEQFSVPSKRKNGPGRVWVYQKNKQPDQRATTVQGFEKGYFAFVKPDGTVDESFEARLAKLEGDCNDTLFLAKSVLFDSRSASRRNSLAFYSALLFSRATQRRNRNAESWVKIQKEFAEAVNDDVYINDLASHYSKRFDVELSPESVRKRLAELSAQLQSPSVVRNNFVTDLLACAEQIKELLLQKPWQVWRPPDGAEFITCDNPLITFIPVGNGELNPGHGFRKEGVVAAFPLAPCACLAMGVSGPESVTLDKARVVKVNETIIRLCDRFVYSKTLSQEVRKFVDDRAGSAKYGKTAFLPLGLNIPTVKEYMRRVLGLDAELPDDKQRSLGQSVAPQLQGGN
jgi:hypothetical protein